MTSAQIDSVVWYAEELELDLAKARLVNSAESDSLKIELSICQMSIELLKANQRKWWDRILVVAELSILAWAAGQID